MEIVFLIFFIILLNIIDPVTYYLLITFFQTKRLAKLLDVNEKKTVPLVKMGLTSSNPKAITIAHYIIYTHIFCGSLILLWLVTLLQSCHLKITFIPVESCDSSGSGYIALGLNIAGIIFCIYEISRFIKLNNYK